MTLMRRTAGLICQFLTDYCQRHKHPANAVLHIIGVPAAVAGACLLCTGHLTKGVALLLLGYLLQYQGHRAQGNEVGEIILVKRIWQRLHGGQS